MMQRILNASVVVAVACLTCTASVDDVQTSTITSLNIPSVITCYISVRLVSECTGWTNKNCTPNSWQ